MLDIHRLSEAGGAEIAGVDVAALDAARFAELEHALYEHQVIVLRALAPSAHEFHAFARRFGTPEPHVIDQFHHPDIPDILILSNVKVDGTPIGLTDGG